MDTPETLGSVFVGVCDGKSLGERCARRPFRERTAHTPLSERSFVLLQIKRLSHYLSTGHFSKITLSKITFLVPETSDCLHCTLTMSRAPGTPEVDGGEVVPTIVDGIPYPSPSPPVGVSRDRFPRLTRQDVGCPLP